MLKNIKVGGTSLEVELSKILPQNSIVTKIYPQNSNHVPRNFDGFYNHIPYLEIKNKIDISSAKCYVFIRNPYSIVLSNFFHNYNMNNEWINLSDEEKQYAIIYYFKNDMLKSTKNIYTDKFNNILVDKVLIYEKGIESEINSILPLHNIDCIKINTFEKQFKPKNIDYISFFSKSQMEQIYEEWKWEFEAFGYKK
jgi:hypothetical protein